MTDYQGNILIKNPATPTGPFETGSAPGIWRLQEAMAFKRLGIWPTQGVQGADPYYKFVSLLLSTTSLGNANNNLFVDSSGAFLPISRNGNTTQGSMTPYGANWSNYFDGSGDYLSTSSASFAFGTGAWTIEFWIYPLAYGGSICGAQLFGTTNGGQSGYSINLGQDKNSFRIVSNATGGWADNLSAGTNNGPDLNTWTHMAVVRSGANVSIYKNGTRVATTASASAWNFSGTTGIIGRFNDGGNLRDFNGYLSNLRVANSALYDPTQASITVSTSPLTAASGTILLTCQGNRFRDASSNNLTISSTGDTRVTDFSPFSPGSPGIVYNQSDITNWSGYFDGSGDYLSVPSNAAFDLGSSDFTVECWFNANSFAAGFGLISRYNYSGVGLGWVVTIQNSTTVRFVRGNDIILDCTVSAMATGAWYHVAAVRSGSTLTVYLNGAQIGQATGISNFSDATTPLQIGRTNTVTNDINGYISNARVVKGTAVYTGTFTPPTTNLTAISGTSLLTLQNAAFTDNSTNNFVITPNGNVTVTGNSPFNPVGYWSNYFDGSSTITFNTISLAGDFTIEAWVYFIGTNNPTVVGGNPPNNQTLRRVNGKHYFYRQGVDITGTADVPLNQWVHLAATRSNGEVRIFTNGVLDGNRTINGTYTVFCLGGVNTADDRLTGYTSNVRIVDGTALYTATFTPPTAPLTAVSGTALLTSQNGTFKDNSTNNLTLTRNGSPTIQPFDPFYTATIASNGGSVYLDGSDWLNVAPTPALNFGTSDFTVECWVYMSANVSGTQVFMAGWPAGEPVSGWSFAFDGTGFLFASAVSNAYITAYNTAARTTGTWYHVAAVRSSGSVTVYVNGVGGTPVANTQNIITNTAGMDIGRSPYTANRAWFTGYIANARIVKGTALYTSNFTPPTSPVAPTPGTTFMLNSMNAGIYDATAINNMETVGNAQVSTAVSKFGGSSVYLDGTGDYLVVPDSPTSNFGSGDFTIEMWINLNSFSGAIGVLGKRANEGSYSPIVIEASSNTLKLYLSTSGSSWAVSGLSTGTLSTGVWYHYAISRTGSTVYAFVNGVSVGSTGTASGALMTNTSPMTIGQSCMAISASVPLNGYIDDFRITNGYARYTGNFTPPDKAFTVY